MATPGFDGSIKIDSSIDVKGFSRGITSMIRSIRGLAIAATVAFVAVGALGKVVTDAASQATNAWIGLESVVAGSGRSFEQSKKFIQDYVADGLVPVADATTAYKNLLMRGYDTSEIERIMIAFKNAGAFGRQSHLTLGQAIRGATEGLKNENSILVDNVGVTKNVSIMWKEYAQQLGVGVDSLTTAQKRQAELNGIMQETRFQMGDAAKLAGTYSGQVSALGVSFQYLKVALGNILIPVLTRIIPYIRAAIDALTVFFERIAQIMAALFGVNMNLATQSAGAMSDNVEAAESAAEAQGDLASSIDKAKKAAKGALAAFDQLNVLQLQTADVAEVGAIEPSVAIPAVKETALDPALQSIVDRIRTWKEELLTLFAPAIEAFGRLGEALRPLGVLILQGLGWAWQNILVPFGRWAIESFLPKFFDLIAAAVRFVTAAFVVLKPVLMFLWEGFFKPFAQSIGIIIIEILRIWAESLNKIAAYLQQNPDLFLPLVEAAKLAWEDIKLFVLTAWKTLIGVWGGAGLWFSSNVATPIMRAFTTMSEWIKLKLGSGLFLPLVNTARASFNGVIDLINGLLGRVAASVNNMAQIANAISFFGLGPKIPVVAAPRIPYLATGAVIPPNSQFLAVLGDQRSGRNLEAPEGLIRQIIREELGSITADIAIEFTGSLSALVRELQPEIVRENVRVGNNLSRVKP